MISFLMLISPLFPTASLSLSLQPVRSQVLSSRQLASVAAPNITSQMCYPADSSGGQPAVSRPDCEYALQQFVQAHNATPNQELILTNNETEYSVNSPENPYIQNGGIFFPPNEPVGPDNVKCQLEYSVGLDTANSHSLPNASIPLLDFETATNYLIGNCTGTAIGGESALTNADGEKILINVQRASQK
ncbi:hypothetical protein ACLMJK_005632 [Lecanora helva]